MKAEEDIDHESTEYIVCPYCGHIHYDICEFDDNGTADCEECHKEFVYYSNIIYSTQKSKGDKK